MTHTHPEAIEYELASPELEKAATARCESRKALEGCVNMYHRCTLPAGHAGDHECQCGTAFKVRA